MQSEKIASTNSRAAVLEKAFNEFTQTSLQLEDAYRELESRAETLSAALSAAQDERLIQLAEKEKLADRLQGLLQTLPAGVVVLDGHGIVQQSNPGAEALLGPKLAGHQWNELIEEKFAMEGDGPGEFLLRDGREIAVRSRELNTEAGRIVLLSDVTETRKMQRLLARSQRLSEMGQMNARLAHQLRTPLATAILYASQLAGDDSSPRSARYTDRILGSLQHLERMINDMLRFAGGRDTGQTRRFGVNGLFAEVAAHMESQLEEGSVLEFGARTGIDIVGHREELVGALLNLTTNAVENGNGTVHVVLDAVRDDAGITLSVSDNGPGVDPELREKIFEPFFTTRSSGTGLGLAVVASVAHGHGGRIEVSERDGGGAVFSMVLPLADTPAMASGRKASVVLESTGEIA